MIKVIVPVILFVLIVFGISYYWEKSNTKDKKKISYMIGIILIIILIITTYLVTSV
jgi:hypothetical protein